MHCTVTGYNAYKYNIIELSFFVCKLLPQHACDGRETSLITGRCTGSVILGGRGRQFVVPGKSAARIPTLTNFTLTLTLHTHSY